MKTVTLIGDSIRLGYQDGVALRLAGRARVWGPNANGGTSKNVLDHLDEWVLSSKASMVHINCGLHDLRREFGRDASAIPLEQYASNVRAILNRLKAETNAIVALALTTPVNEEWHHKNKTFDRMEADVAAYNRAASEVAKEAGVPVDDLYSIVMKTGRDELLLADGVHFKPVGYDLIAEHVSGFIMDLIENYD